MKISAWTAIAAFLTGLGTGYLLRQQPAAPAPPESPDMSMDQQAVWANQRQMLTQQQTLLSELRELRSATQAHYQGLFAELEQNYRQLEALIALHGQLDFVAALPPMRAWAISPDFATVLLTLVRRQRPQVVLELGAGVSTLIIAYALKELGSGRVIAIDHLEAHASLIGAQLEQHGVADVAEVIHAPLQPIEINGQQWQWYAQDALTDVTRVSLLVVDGPPQYNSPHGLVRYPAMPLLWERLAPDALIMLDDIKRTDEAEILQRWLAEYALEPLQRFETERGAALLRRRSPDG
ncbi:MAG: class I SAM-dependent methyltransferase [Anaerolineales bacterium]